MTVNQQALFRGLNVWLWLNFGLGVLVQIIASADNKEVCTPGRFGEICTTPTPPLVGAGMALAAVLALIAVSSAKGVIVRAANRGGPTPSPEFIARKR